MPFERPSLPNGARCAATLTFDNFGESFDLLRYGHAGGANADGVYAPRRGVGRVLDLLERHEIPATFFVEGWNARKYSALAREVVDRGHEVAGHGWMHERWNELGQETERDLIERTTDAIAEATGKRPTGWRAPSGLTTRWTVEQLKSTGYDYDSSFGDDDVPYWLRVTAESDDEIMELPWTWTLDDAPYYAHPGTIHQPSRVIDLWIEEFEAAYEMTGYFMLVCHPRFAGRPSRIRALDRLIEHIKSYDGVWFARCDELAAHSATASSTPHHPPPETYDV